MPITANSNSVEQTSAAMEQQLRDALSRMPQVAGALDALIEARLNVRREIYESQPAGELNRGRVLELRAILSFLRTGDFADV